MGMCIKLFRGGKEGGYRRKLSLGQFFAVIVLLASCGSLQGQASAKKKGFFSLSGRAGINFDYSQTSLGDSSFTRPPLRSRFFLQANLKIHKWRIPLALSSIFPLKFANSFAIPPVNPIEFLLAKGNRFEFHPQLGAWGFDIGQPDLAHIWTVFSRPFSIKGFGISISPKNKKGVETSHLQVFMGISRPGTDADISSGFAGQYQKRCAILDFGFGRKNHNALGINVTIARDNSNSTGELPGINPEGGASLTLIYHMTMFENIYVRTEATVTVHSRNLHLSPIGDSSYAWLYKLVQIDSSSTGGAAAKAEAGLKFGKTDLGIGAEAIGPEYKSPVNPFQRQDQGKIFGKANFHFPKSEKKSLFRFYNRNKLGFQFNNLPTALSYIVSENTEGTKDGQFQRLLIDSRLDIHIGKQVTAGVAYNTFSNTTINDFDSLKFVQSTRALNGNFVIKLDSISKGKVMGGNFRLSDHEEWFDTSRVRKKVMAMNIQFWYRHPSLSGKWSLMPRFFFNHHNERAQVGMGMGVQAKFLKKIRLSLNSRTLMQTDQLGQGPWRTGWNLTSSLNYSPWEKLTFLARQTAVWRPKGKTQSFRSFYFHSSVTYNF